MSEISRKQIDEFLVKEFPGKVVDYVGEGWSSFAFRVGGRIIRVPRKTEIIKNYEREAKICEFVRSFITLPIPKIKAVRGKIPYAVHRELKGEKFNNARLLEMTVGQRNKIALDSARFMAELHSIPFGEIQKTVPDLAFYKPKAVKDLKKCAAAYKGFLSAPKIKMLLAGYVAAVARANKRKGFVYCHGDFHGGNSLVDKRNKLCGVFDWCGGEINIPECDIKRVFELMPSVFDLFLPEYNRLSGRKIRKSDVSDQLLIRLVECAHDLLDQTHLVHIREKAMKDLAARAAPYVA
ncbi:MAG: aminoglycoside phosphotransferase family protein [Alphaproteobacteria bacterium]|nr:aminoglycoside phosphotransferase family protein [Alphaproteobacteria bacterium]